MMVVVGAVAVTAAVAVAVCSVVFVQGIHFI